MYNTNQSPEAIAEKIVKTLGEIDELYKIEVGGPNDNVEVAEKVIALRTRIMLNAYFMLVKQQNLLEENVADRIMVLLQESLGDSFRMREPFKSMILPFVETAVATLEDKSTHLYIRTDNDKVLYKNLDPGSLFKVQDRVYLTMGDGLYEVSPNYTFVKAKTKLFPDTEVEFLKIIEL